MSKESLHWIRSGVILCGNFSPLNPHKTLEPKMRKTIPLMVALTFVLGGCATKIPNPAKINDPIEFAKEYKNYDEFTFDLPADLLRPPMKVFEDHQTYSIWWCGNTEPGQHREFQQRMARVCRNLGGEMYRNEWCRDKETGNLALFRYSFSSTYDISRCITIGTKRRVPVVSVHVDAPLEGVDPKTDRAWQKFAASQGFVTKATTEEMEKEERRQVALLLKQRDEEEKRRQELARQRQEEARQHAKWQRETGYLLSPSSKGTSVCSKKAIDGRNYKAFIEDSNGLRLQLRLTEELINGRYVILQNQRIIWDNVNNWKECR